MTTKTLATLSNNSDSVPWRRINAQKHAAPVNVVSIVVWYMFAKNVEREEGREADKRGKVMRKKCTKLHKISLKLGKY